MKRITATISCINKETGDADLFINVYHNMDSIEFEALDRGNPSDTINYGIYSNRGTLSFLDHKSGFLNLIEKYEKNKSKYDEPIIDVYLSSDTFDRKLAFFYIEDYDYDKNTKKVVLQLTDNLTKLESVKEDRIFSFEDQTIETIFEDRFHGKVFADDFLKEIMQKTRTRFIDTKNLNNRYRLISGFCEAFMARCFYDESGNLLIHSGKKESVPIVIRPKNIISISNKTKKEKNKINSAELSVLSPSIFINSKYGNDVSFRVLNLFDNFPAMEGDVTFGDFIYPSLASLSDGENANVSSMSLNGYLINGTVEYEIRIKLDDNVYFVNDKPVITIKTVSWNSRDTYLSDATKTEKSTLNGSLSPVNYSVEWDKGNNVAIIRFSTYALYSPDSEDWFHMNGERIAYEVGKTHINATYYEDRDDYVISFGDEDKESLPTNDILNRFLTYSNGEESIIIPAWILNETKRIYQNGLESMELECNISDYYYADGDLAKDSSGKYGEIQSFEKYDLVIPYVFEEGMERPVSTNPDGSPKIFKIVGIKYKDSGVVRQVLHLQEYYETNLPLQEE